MNFAINGKEIHLQGIRELKAGMTIEQASLKTKNNGIDEVYFIAENKAYVAYGDKLNISDLKKREIPMATYNGKQADIVSFEDELNTMGEGILKGATSAWKQTAESVIGTVKSIIGTIGPTGVLAVGGGVAGMAIYSMMKKGAISATLSSTGGALGAAFSSGVLGAIKVAGIAGAVGLGVSGIAGAFSGAMEAINKEKNYQTIASVTKDGAAVANGGVVSRQHSNHGRNFSNPVQTFNPAQAYNNNSNYYNNYQNTYSNSNTSLNGLNLLSPEQLLLNR